MIKKIVNSTLSKLGLKIQKVSSDNFNLDLYKLNFSEESINCKRFYNIGAGSFFHPFWTNVDYISDWYKSNDELTQKGIHYNLMSLEQIPIDSGTSEIVYSSHTIEHIKDDHAQNFFNESHRILRKKGIFRVTCPDIDLHYAAFKNRDLDFFYWRNWYHELKDYKRIYLNTPLTKASIEQLFLQRFATAATTIHADGIEDSISDDECRRIFKELKYEDALNYCCRKCPIEIQKKYPGNHTNWWNKDKVIRMLKSAGFKEIYISGYGQSKSAVLRNTTLFDNTHPKISLYIEARK